VAAKSPPTKSSTPRLSEIARHVVVPKDVVTTGWPAVEAKCAELGITFRPWQQGAGRVILAKRAGGKYASTIGGTGLSIPRQVGKTFLVGAIVFALCLLLPNLTVIWTAHRLRTGEETFKKMQALARRKKIAPHVLKLVLGSGEEEIEFRNGSRIMFGARERGFGRGFDEVDVLIFDEGQILSGNALDDMIPATNQSRQPTGALLLFMGTPPKPTDPGDVFRRMRTEALAGEDDDTGWIEFGADPGFEPTATPAPLTAADWVQVAKANPSYPQDTPREAILRMRKNLGADSFTREGLGIWDEVGGAVSQAGWRSCLDAKSKYAGGRMALGLHLTGDRSTAYVVAAGLREDGLVHVEILDIVSPARGVQAIKARTDKHRCAVALDPGSHAGSFIQPLEDAGVRVEEVTLQKFTQACGMVIDHVNARTLRHIGQPPLDAAVFSAGVKVLSRDSWIWDGPGIAPLKAMTLARHGYASVEVFEPLVAWR
jgi:hypothetical protein